MNVDVTSSLEGPILEEVLAAEIGHVQLSSDVDPRAARIDYTNHRGERSIRQIIPVRVVFESNEWHPEPQWLLVAWDLEKGAERTFALKGVHAWLA